MRISTGVSCTTSSDTTFNPSPSDGWSGPKDGALLSRAASPFDVLVIPDSAMEREHDLSRVAIAVDALRARSNRLADPAPLMPKLLATRPSLRAGQFVVIG